MVYVFDLMWTDGWRQEKAKYVSWVLWGWGTEDYKDALCCGMQVHFETTDHLLNQCPVFTIFINSSILWSWDSVVGIATHYRLDGPGIKSRWGARFSAPVKTGSEPHPASYTMGTGSLPGG